MRHRKRNKNIIQKNKFINSYLNKDLATFWNEINRKNNNKSTVLITIEGISGSKNTAEFWKENSKVV